MKNLISLFIFLLFALLGMWWYYSCSWCNKDVGENKTVVEQIKAAEAEALAKKAYEDSIAALKNTSLGLVAKDGNGQDIFSYPDNLQINSANGDVSIPGSLSGFSDQIVGYLGKHQDQELTISGYENRAESENNSGLGIARANFIKDMLVKKGINADRIVTKAESGGYAYNDEGKYNGGISLDFGTLDASRLAEVEKSVASRTLYSAFAQKKFKPDATLVNYALELKNYLKKYPNKTVLITGHTDDVGSERDNRWYGRERAKNVKKYLVSQGIAKEKIKTASKGETDPIVPNNSEENKAKNRRIEITVN